MRFKAIILIAIFALLYSQVAYAKGVNNAVDEFTAFQNQLRAKANPANSEQGADGSSYYNNINENRPPPEKLLSFSVPEEAALLKANFEKLAKKAEVGDLTKRDLDEIISDVCVPYFGVQYMPIKWFNACKMVADKEAEIESLKQKAIAGDVDRQFQLGMHYACLGMAGAFPAIKWLKMAAEQGDVDAQVQLAQTYYQGISIASDFESAYFWASIALSGVIKQPPADGNEQHKQKDIQGVQSFKDHALSRISNEARTEIQKRIDGWKPSSNVPIPPRRNKGNLHRFLGCPQTCGTGTTYDGP